MTKDPMKREYKGYQVGHLNTRSFLRHKDEIALALSDNEIVCITETWLSNHINDNMVALPSFNFVRQDRDCHIRQPGVKSRGGGLLTFYKERLSPYVTAAPNLNQVNKLIEQLWIKLEKPGWKRMYVT